MGGEEKIKSEGEVIDEEVEDVEVFEIQISFCFPDGMSPAIAVQFAVYYCLLLCLAISYYIERQRIIDEYGETDLLT